MDSPPIQPGAAVHGASGAASGTSDSAHASIAPTPDHVSWELSKDIGDIKNQKALTSNWKMKLGIALGVLVGIAVIAIVGGAVIASHGTLGAMLGIVATKLSLGAKLAAHAMHGGKILASTISAITTAIIFLGGGTIAGKLVNKGEREGLETLIPASLKKFKEFEKDLRSPVTESEIEEHLTKNQATVLSVQSGRNFVQAGRRAKLHYAPSAYKGFSGIVKKVVKAFGHFWGVVASTTMKSLFDRKQYALYNENHIRERILKLQSARGDLEASSELNALRSTQIEQYVGKLDVIGVAYAKAPELLAYDRIIAKLEILKSKHPSRFAQIDSKILEAKENKLELIKTRLEVKDLGSISGSSGPAKSLLTVSEDIMKLPELTEEAKGQILEAVSILLRQNSECTINHVNELILILVENSRFLVTDNKLSAREHTIKYAEKFAEAYRSESPFAPPFIDLPQSYLEIKKSSSADSATLAQEGQLGAIKESIEKLSDITEEAKGQIINAVSTLQRSHPDSRISDVRQLIKILYENRESLIADGNLSTRDYTMTYAKKFGEAYRRDGAYAPHFLDPNEKMLIGTILPKILTTNLYPMSTISGHHLILKTMDVAISAIHAMPVTGSSVIAAGLTAYAVTKEKGGSFMQVIRKVGAAVARAFAKSRKS